jgi:hypothetical protein
MVTARHGAVQGVALAAEDAALDDIGDAPGIALEIILELRDPVVLAAWKHLPRQLVSDSMFNRARGTIIHLQ